MRILEIIVAITFPPIAVIMRYGIGKKLFINVLLTMIGYFPGMVHALILVAKPKLKFANA